MATDETWGRALRNAKRDYEKRHDTDLTYKGMGKRLGEILGRDPIPHPTVRSWFVDGQEPDTFLPIARALATMLEVDVAALLTPAAPEVARDDVNQTAEPKGEAPKRRTLADAADPFTMPKVTKEELAERATSKSKPGRRRRA